MKSVKLIGLIISILLFVASCNKEDGYKHKRLDKITIQMECVIDGETVSYPEVNHMVFFWDGKLLSSIDYYDEGEYWWSDVYSYDDQKRVTSIESHGMHRKTDFLYEGDKLKQAIVKENKNTENCYYTWEDNKLSQMTVIYQSGDTSSVVRFYWNGNNVSKSIHNTIAPATYSLEYEYDNYLNPFHNLFPFSSLTARTSYNEHDYGFNQNNVIRALTILDTEEDLHIYTYTYKGKYPDTRTETVRNGEDVIKYIYRYYYK